MNEQALSTSTQEQPIDELKHLKELIDITGSLPLSIVLFFAIFFYSKQKKESDIQATEHANKLHELENQVNQIKFEIADLRHNDQTQALFKQQLEDTKQKVHRLEFVIESIETPAPKKID